MTSNILSLLTFLMLSAKGATSENIFPVVQKYWLKNDRNIILNVPFIHQLENLTEEEKLKIRATACGPAALTMLFQFHGKDVTLGEVIEALPNSVYVKGQRFYNLYKGPEYFSMSSVKITKEPKDIFNTLQKNQPIILNVQNYDGITGHALVIVGMIGFDGEQAKSLVIHDPFVGPYREFSYETKTILKQPEGYKNYMGNLEPFYIENVQNLLVLK